MFTQDMFRKGRKDMLIFIERNQKRSAHIGGKDAADEPKAVAVPANSESNVRKDNMAAFLVKEIAKLQSQQQELQSEINMRNMMADEADMTFQRIITYAYNRYCLFLRSCGG